MSTERTFIEALRRLGSNFTETILYISRPNELDLNLSLPDIPQTKPEECRTFDFLKDIESKYPIEFITASQFIFLIASLAFRYHSETTRFDENDIRCTKYLMRIWPTVKKKFDIKGARLDFYKWYIRQFLKSS